jgi:formylglycine-generating enzyme required for sulfatase activity
MHAFVQVKMLVGVASSVLLLLLFSIARAQQQTPDRMAFVRIAPGEFTMGCSPDDKECGDAEKPPHRIRIMKTFEIGRYEVTQAQWESVMGTNRSMFRGPSRPVENVSWFDAQEFMRRMTAVENEYRYRLPTEAEWEYAARAGSTTAYSDEALQVGWYQENSGEQTHPVGQKKPNAWGLYDMSGNVWEWTQDWYDATYYQRSPTTDPTGPSSGRFHTIRGGAWVEPVENSRVSKRDYFEDAADFHIGFRCVREPFRQVAE